MTLEPLLHASPAIQLHVLAVVPAAALGAILLTRRKGTPAHRLAGRIWVGLMVLTALSSFFIHTINIWGPFSPIHLLSVLVLGACWRIVQTARGRRIAQHRLLVRMVYFGGIGIAGLFTLLPGRIMHEVVFGAAPMREPGAGLGPAGPGLGALVTAAPLWVWPLLALLVALGVSRMRDRNVSLWRLLATPVILMLVFLGFAVARGIGAGEMLALACAACLGVSVGWSSMRGVAAVRVDATTVRVQGEAVSLVVIIGIFASRFAAGAIAAVAPDLAGDPGMSALLTALPFFFASLLMARALAQAGFNPLTRTGPRLSPETGC